MPLPEFPCSDRSNPSRTVAFLLAGGQGSRLHELTSNECKPALFFAGPRRIVDFTMANTVRAGIRHMMVATQFKPATLAGHLDRRWGSAFENGGLQIRDGATVTGAAAGYLGTAHAVAANIPALDAARPDQVIVLAGGHIHDMDYAAMIAAHRASGAEVTIAAATIPAAATSAFGVLETAADNRIVNFVEKPDDPQPMPQSSHALVSMGIYVFSWPWLRAALLADLLAPVSTHDFGADILPGAVAEGVAYLYRQQPQAGADQPYWRDVGTLDAFRQGQLDFATLTPPCALPDTVAAAAPDVGGSGDRLQFGYELASGGVVLRAPRYGQDKPGRWTVLDESIIMPGARVLPGVRLTRAIVAPGTVVPAGLVVGEDPQEDARWFRRTEAGTTLITTPMLARRNADRPRQHSGSRWSLPFLPARTA